MKTIIKIFLSLLAVINVCSGCGDKSRNNNAVADEASLKADSASVNPLENVSVVEIDTCLVLLTVHRSDCSACGLLFEDSVYINYKLRKINVDMVENNDSKLLAQVLWNSAFPSAYFINSDYEIIGITQGPIEFEEHADSICKFKTRFHDLHMIRAEKDSVLSMLSYSLKALREYSKQNIAQAKKDARLSLRKGSYFFNNYLLYKIYEGENKTDSMNYYRRGALEHNRHINIHLYDNLIEELNAKK